MDAVSQIVNEFTNHAELEGYPLLCLALTEQWKHLPQQMTVKQICAAISENAGKTPGTVYRALARAVDDIYSGEESLRAVSKYCRVSLYEKLTAKELLLSVSKYLNATYGAYSTYESAIYHPCMFIGSQSYGILIYSEKAHMPYVTAPISDDLDKVKGIILTLNQAKMPLTQLSSIPLIPATEKMPSSS